MSKKIRQLNRAQAHEWDLSAIERLDHAGGQALWRVWDRKWPASVRLTDMQRQIFERIAALDERFERPDRPERINFVTGLGLSIFQFLHHMTDGIALLGAFILDCGRVLCGRSKVPWSEISANVYTAGARALPITALVGFLIGIVLSYLSSQQLRLFGASTYIVNVLGLTIIRELGPVLAAILVAGRSGSAITAQIGVMRVTEELDAMQVMGIPHGLRLVFPRVIALAIAMPLLIVWTDIVALFGGAVAAHFSLDIDMSLFLHQLPNVVPIRNVWIGLLKGVAFGMLIALTGCHFGFRIKPNSQSLGAGDDRLGGRIDHRRDPRRRGCLPSCSSAWGCDERSRTRDGRSCARRVRLPRHERGGIRSGCRRSGAMRRGMPRAARRWRSRYAACSSAMVPRSSTRTSISRCATAR